MGFLYLLLGGGVRGEGLGLSLETLLLLLSAALAGGLVLVAVGLCLLGDGLDTSVFGLELVDGLNQVALVLVDASLDLEVKLVVQVLVDLLLSAVLGEQAAEDAKTADPESLLALARVGATLALSETSVSAQKLSCVSLANAESRDCLGGLTGDQAILVKLADGLTRVRRRDLVDLIGVKPDTALSASLSITIKFNKGQKTSFSSICSQFPFLSSLSESVTYKNGSCKTLLHLKGDHFASSTPQA